MKLDVVDCFHRRSFSIFLMVRRWAAHLPLSVAGARLLGGGMGRSWLPQAEVVNNEEHHYHDANNIKNAVHVASSFLSRNRITGE
jgi:hypothetical protein